jgi:hypothetical protein
MRVAGEQRRIQEAENFRGYEGGELTFDDFIGYIDYLQHNQTSWL